MVGKKIKEDEKCKKFRWKGVDPKMSDLWDAVYSQIVATGKHCVAAIMEPASVLRMIAENEGENDDVDEEESDGEDDDEAEQVEMGMMSSVPGVNMDTPVEDLSHQTGGSVAASEPLHQTRNSVSKGKKPSETGSASKSITKKRKRKLSGSVLYSQHIAMMEETGKKMLTLMVGEIGGYGEGRQPVKFYDYAAVMAVVDRLVAQVDIVESSPLWCFAVSELGKADRREVFMTITGDSAKVAWLIYEFENKNAGN